MNKVIPCCSFPTTILFIDDDESFLRSLHGALLQKIPAAYLFWNSSTKALEYLKSQYKADPFTTRSLKNVESHTFEHYLLSIDIENLYQEAYNPKRFSQVSTVVVDYDMPGMDGIEFCKQFQDPFVQKILLTGAADEHLAIEAFNNRWIHKFIRKQDDNIEKALENAIFEAQQKYFWELSNTMVRTAASKPDYPSALTDPVFVDYFFNVIKENKIVEYYLFESVGSFLMLDVHGNIKGLFTQNKDQIDAAYYEIKDEETVSEDLKQSLKAYESILCYKIQSNKPMLSPDQWKPYIYKAHKISGSNNYYCAVTPNIFEIDTQSLVAFGGYQKDHQAFKVR